MKVKVIKAFKGLEIGDILNFNDKEYRYELTKTNEDVSENGTTVSKKFYSFNDWTIKENKEYFQFIDEQGNTTEVIEHVEEQLKRGTPLLDEIDEKDKKIKELEDKIKELEVEKEMVSKFIWKYKQNTPYFWLF